MVEVMIDSIRVSLMTQHRVVVLRDSDGDRYLPIWIGPFEADAITIQLQGVQVPRPLTHDLLKSFIRELGVKVSHVLVTELRNDTFFARIVMDVNGTSMEIDSRPDRRIKVVLTVPVDAARGKTPAVVCIHGHGGKRDIVYDPKGIYRGFAKVLAERGYVTLSTNVGQHEVQDKEQRTLMGERLWDLIRVVELEPLVVEAVLAVAQRPVPSLQDERVRLSYGDARNVLLVESATYDIIVSQPSHPWVPGTGNLFTREFFDIVRQLPFR